MKTDKHNSIEKLQLSNLLDKKAFCPIGEVKYGIIQYILNLYLFA